MGGAAHGKRVQTVHVLARDLIPWAVDWGSQE